MTPTPQEAREALAKVKYSLNAEDVSPNSERIKLIRAYITASEARIQELEKENEALRTAATFKSTSDTKDDLSDVIEAAHPLRHKPNWPHWLKAQGLVSNRHSKYALVDLTSYLLSQLAERDALLAEAVGVLMTQPCVRPCNNRPSDFTVGQCLAAGECGCDAASVAQKIRKVKP